MGRGATKGKEKIRKKQGIREVKGYDIEYTVARKRMTDSRLALERDTFFALAL